jgi:hypothetical protein
VSLWSWPRIINLIEKLQSVSAFENVKVRADILEEELKAFLVEVKQANTKYPKSNFAELMKKQEERVKKFWQKDEHGEIDSGLPAALICKTKPQALK